MYVCIYIYIHIYLNNNTYVYIYIYIYTYTYIYIYIYMYIHIILSLRCALQAARLTEVCGAQLHTRSKRERARDILAIFYPFYPFSQFCEKKRIHIYIYIYIYIYIVFPLLSLQTQPKTAPNLFQRGVEYGKYGGADEGGRWPADHPRPRFVSSRTAGAGPG